MLVTDLGKTKNPSHQTQLIVPLTLDAVTESSVKMKWVRHPEAVSGNQIKGTHSQPAHSTAQPPN